MPVLEQSANFPSRSPCRAGMMKTLAAVISRDKSTMKITLYVRTYLVKDAPVALSFVPTPSHQKHTYTLDGKVYDAVSREMRVTVPDGSVIDMDRKFL